MSRDPRRSAAGAHGGSRRGASGFDGRTHHIADVAHHFLADDRPPAPFVFVAGPAAAADLALELASGWARTAGEAVGFVDAAPVARGNAEGGTPEVSRRRPEDPSRPGECAVFWHLGPLDRCRLDDLDAVGRVPGAGLPGAGRRRLILWCLGASAAGAWSPLVELGRLAGALRTRGAFLVVEAPGRPTHLLENLRRRAAVAAGGDTGLVALPEPARPGARAAAIAGLPGLLLPSAP